MEFDIEISIFTVNDYEVEANDFNMFEEYGFEKAKLIIENGAIKITLKKKSIFIQKQLIIHSIWIEKKKAKYIFETTEKIFFIPFKRIFSVLIKFKYLDMDIAKSEILKFNL